MALISEYSVIVNGNLFFIFSYYSYYYYFQRAHSLIFLITPQVSCKASPYNLHWQLKLHWSCVRLQMHTSADVTPGSPSVLEFSAFPSHSQCMSFGIISFCSQWQFPKQNLIWLCSVSASNLSYSLWMIYRAWLVLPLVTEADNCWFASRKGGIFVCVYGGLCMHTFPFVLCMYLCIYWISVPPLCPHTGSHQIDMIYN